MSKSFLSLLYFFLLAAALAVAGYIVHVRYMEVAQPCRVPLAYGLGIVDQRFELSRPEALRALLAAEDIWESDTGDDIFSYDENAALKVHFRFDERQAETVRARELREDLSQKDQEFEQKQIDVEALEVAQNRAVATFNANVDLYEADLAKYNKKVKKINKDGGTDDDDEFDDLEDEKDDLDDRRKELQRTQESINAQAGVVSGEITKLNAFGQSINSDVTEFNDDFAQERIFDQGQYGFGEIVIYQYETFDGLRMVLAHELGHARGAEHVTDTSAIMHEIFRDQDKSNPQLTIADRGALEAACDPGVRIRFANFIDFHIGGRDEK